MQYVHQTTLLSVCHLPKRESLILHQNRGIGQAICKLILAKPSIAPLKLFATTRKGEDLELIGNAAEGGRQVLYPTLDISSRDSIRAFAGVVKQHGDVDVLINNAGVNLDGRYGYENARRTLEVNYEGTLEVGHVEVIALVPCLSMILLLLRIPAD